MSPLLSWNLPVFIKNFLIIVRKSLSKLLDSNREAAQEPCKKAPGRAVLIENNVFEEKPFKTNDELPETSLYYGGEKETDAEHEMRMIRVSQREEMDRL